jgi:ATP phosphoribosyltransferase
LGFQNVKFRLLFQKFEYNSIKDLDGLRIATSYPNTVNEYFNSFGVKVDIHQISGSVEIAQILVLQMLLSILYPAEVLYLK